MSPLTLNCRDLSTQLAKEKKSPLLSRINEDFYGEIRVYIGELQREYTEALKRNNTNKIILIGDELTKAKELIRDIYKHRERKILKMAADHVALENSSYRPSRQETRNLLPRENELFRKVVNTIRRYQQILIDLDDPAAESNIGAGATQTRESRAPGGKLAHGTDRAPGDAGADTSWREGAAKDMGDIEETKPPGKEDMKDEREKPGGTVPTVKKKGKLGRTGEISTHEGEREEEAAPTMKDEKEAAPTMKGEKEGPEPDDEGPEEASPPELREVGRAEMDEEFRNTFEGAAHYFEKTGRILVIVKEEVPPFLGVDRKSYRLTPDDIITLPAINAELLARRGIVEIV